MSKEVVKEYFKKYGIEDKILEFKESSATVELASKAIGCKPEHIAKTLSFKVNNNAILIVVAGDAKIDNSKYKDEFGTKAKMLIPEEVEEMIGHKIGEVCPFAIKEGVKVYLDTSLKRFEYIYPAAGSSNSAIKLLIEELEKYSNYEKWVSVSKIK